MVSRVLQGHTHALTLQETVHRLWQICIVLTDKVTYVQYHRYSTRDVDNFDGLLKS